MKDLLFIVKDETIMIKGKYDPKDNNITFKALDESENYYSIDELENIEDNFAHIFEEDQEALLFLIESIKADDTLISRIKAKESSKLLFVYEMVA